MRIYLSLLFLFCCSLNLFAQLNADAGPDMEICHHDSVKVIGSGLSAGDTGTYQWKDLSSGTISIGAIFKKAMHVQGIFVVELLVTKISNGNTFTDRDSFEIKVKALPLVIIDVPDTVCSSSSAFVLNNIQPAELAGTWSGNGVIGRNFDPSVSSKTKQYFGPVVVKFEYKDPLTACTAIDSAFILIQTQPEITIDNTKPYQQCEDKIFAMKSTPKWTSSWKWSGAGDGNFTSLVVKNTNYSAGVQDTINSKIVLTIITDPEGVCPQANDNITLIFEPYPQFSLPEHFVKCEPVLIDFSSTVYKPAGSPNMRYTWLFGNGDSLQNSTDGNPKGIKYPVSKKEEWYDVRLTVSNQWGPLPGQSCMITVDSLYYVRVLPQPKASFSINPDNTATVNAPEFKFYNNVGIRWGKVNCLWNFDIHGSQNDTSTEANPVHTYPADTGTYWVNLHVDFIYYNNHNFMTYPVICSDDISKMVKVMEAKSNIIVYTIQPNNYIRLNLPFNGKLKIIDAIGQVIQTMDVWANKMEDFDISSWANGNYIFELENGKEKSVAKFVKFR